MSIVRRSILVLAQLALIIIGGAACETVSDQLTPSASTTTLMPGWESRFKLDWKVEPDQRDGRRVRGQISSKYGDHAEPVRVLTQALDSSGGVVGQRIDWIPGGVGGFGHASFDIPHLPAADRYRVTIWDYTLIEGSSFR